ncbi:MAG: restriction endonuclease subunit S [Desulfobacter postgatei]|uniref:restriction endonuclease subunit S n=1 Tax=Desulfobacter postgatei TaxID=2293 RepID=UPI0023F0DC6C|nr:restriction endonuclease subunit S [Desulfobacter postgatei]MDD4273200.1 restriction endonuclease subunit S [Desulfobacter postgatei]
MKIKDKKKQTDSQGLVPKLRFPEFQDAGEWKVSPLGKKLLKCPEYGINAPAVPYSKKLPTYLRITDISEDGYFIEKQKVSVAKEVIADNYLREGDIALARTGASVGKAYRYRESDGELVFAGFLIRIRPDQKKLNTEFLIHFLSTEQYWTWVSFTSARSGQPGINGKEYASLPVPLPPTMSEQQKIADCLSSLDQLIAAQAHKLDTLKSHKKGLMQQLFPAPGQTTPTLRFPEFRNAGEWKETALGQLGKIVSGLTYRPDDIREEGLLVLRSSNIQNGLISLEDSVYVTPKIKGANPTKPNDILICVRNGSKSLIGKNALIPEEMPSCTHGAFMTILRAKSAKFIFQLFQTEIYKRHVEADLGATINSINSTQLKKYALFIPKPDEQQKIADCLSSLDELIAAQAHKLDTLKAHKKGLMQQLFPNPDEADR